MDLSLNADQVAILDSLESLTRPYAGVSLHETGFSLTDGALDRELQQGGFLDVASDPDLGMVTAAIVVERLARLPQATRAALASIIAPILKLNTQTPLCIVAGDQLQRPLRFLGAGATVVVVTDTVSSFTATASQVRAEPDALYGYPVGTLVEMPSDREEHDVGSDVFMTHWRIALAAECAGLLAAALDSVCAYTAQRHQFGRPLASFQGMRHRLAEAKVRTNGVYWLAMRAGATLNPADAALAALHAQESARQVVYDLHQFMGGMGMTLEHPLHLWTYRLKLLASEMGGRGNNALAAARSIWG